LAACVPAILDCNHFPGKPIMKLSASAILDSIAAFWRDSTGSAQLGQGEGQRPGVQQPQEIEVAVKIDLRYLLFLPEDYDKKDSWPLILFLHGVGESGTDLDKVKQHGPAKIVQTKKDFPFIVVAPQSRHFGWNVDSLIGLLDHVVSTHRVDPRRIYLTGLSMGGYGTWFLAAHAPDRFAAAVPICGGGDPNNAAKLKNLPIWVFHGAKDPAIPISNSEKMVEAIKAEGGNVKFTVYPDAGHDSWTETYDNPKLYEWLLKQKRDKR
jgi:predicted peptidase